MTNENHKKIHEELHESFDELVADFLLQNPSVMLKDLDVESLLLWSYRQTQEPTEDTQ